MPQAAIAVNPISPTAAALSLDFGMDRSQAQGEPGDDALLVRAKAGDSAACDELFRRHWTISLRVAYRLLGNEHDANDSVQAAMLKALRNLQSFDGRSQFRTWLLRIVTNTALDDGRRRGRRKLQRLDWSENPQAEPRVEVEPTHSLQNQELGQALSAALAKLTPTLRTTFVLFAEGLSYKDIADCERIPIGTVMSRIHEARKKLQGHLGPMLES